MAIPSTASGATVWTAIATRLPIIDATVGKNATTIAVTNLDSTNLLLVWVKGLHKEIADGTPDENEYHRLEPSEKEYFRVGIGGLHLVYVKSNTTSTLGKHGIVADEHGFN